MIGALIAAWHRLAAIVRRRRLDRDLDEELAFHLAMREAEYAREGLSPDAARAAARRQFGNIPYFKEQAHSMWTFGWLEDLGQDARFAVRTLRKSPAFAVVAIATLALGIGGNTAIFSLVDAVRAHAVPYPDSDRLVQLWGDVMRTRRERRGASYPDFEDWRSRAKSFDAIAAFDNPTQTLLSGDEPERLPVEFVSASYFSLLGVAPARGRAFLAEEDELSHPGAVALLSDALWKRRFGGSLDVVGRSITLNGRPCTVVGVMGPGFKGVTDTAQLWLPFAAYAPAPAMANRGNRGFGVLARLRQGVTVAAAQQEMNAISRQLEVEHPDTNEARGVEVSPIDVELFGAFRPALLALMAAVGFVLLIACANVANLLIARSEARRREMAVRSAIGAGRARLIRQLLTEACVLTFSAAVAGLALARIAVTMMVARSPVTFPSFVTPELDARVAAFTIAVSLACGIVVGVLPAAQVQSIDLSGALKDTARQIGSRRWQWLRSGLVVAEASLAVVLLIGAGLMIRSVRNLAALDPGFDPRSMLTLRISIPRMAPTAGAAPSTPAPAVVESTSLVNRIRAVPGVAAVAIGTDLPLDGNASAGFYSAEGMGPTNAQNMPRAYTHRVSADFFSTLRIPFIAGRTFTDTEQSPSTPAVIVSERLTRRFWPGQDPIGRRIKFGTLAANTPWLHIVGVVGEVKYRGLPENPTADPDVYLPLTDRNLQFGLAIRTTIPPASASGAVRAAIRAADPSIPIYDVATIEELVGNQTAQSRFTMWLMTVFAGIALALAVVGVYGVMSYLVAQRTREIGVRLALGATAGDILRLVVGNGARLVGAGLLVGSAAAFALQKLVASLLFGVTAADAASAAAVAILAAAALLACYLPAARATRVDPLHALRQE